MCHSTEKAKLCSSRKRQAEMPGTLYPLQPWAYGAALNASAVPEPHPIQPTPNLLLSHLAPFCNCL